MLLRVLCRELRLAGRYLLLRWKYRFLRGGPFPPPHVPSVLCVSLTHHPVYALLEGMLLLTLRLRGVRPVVLTYRTARWPMRTFRVFGVRDFLFFDDDLRAASHPDDDRLFDALFAGRPSFQDLLHFLIEESATGEHALSTVARKLRTGGGELGDARTLAIIRAAFLASLRAHRAAAALFRRVSFDHVLFHEKGYTPFGEVFDQSLRQGWNTVQYFFGQLPNSLVLKRYTRENRRAHPFSLSRKSWEHVLRELWTHAQEEAFLQDLQRSYEEGTWFGRKFLLRGKRLKTPEEVRRQLHLDPRKKTAVIYSHILWDATFFYGENLFDDYEQWLIATVNVACQNPAVNWVIKLHPDYVWKMKDMSAGTPPRDCIALRKSFGDLPSHVQVVMPTTDIATYSFFLTTDYCITVRGTVGIEAACFGIPVLTAGTGRYSGCGFTVDSPTRVVYIDRLQHIQDIPPITPAQTSLARRHAHALFHRRLWRHTSFSTDRTRLCGGTLDHRVLLHVRSLREVEQAEDLRRFVDWVLCSREEDYLA